MGTENDHDLKKDVKSFSITDDDEKGRKDHEKSYEKKDEDMDAVNAIVPHYDDPETIAWT